LCHETLLTHSVGAAILHFTVVELLSQCNVMLSVLFYAVVCLCTEQAVDDVATIATNKHQLNGSQPLVHVDSVTNSDLSNSLPATQVT